jgi:deoxyribonuclease-4
MKEARARYDLTPLVIHDNYLINLASGFEPLREKSIAAFRAELDRALAIGAEYLVTHPGCHTRQSVDEGIGTMVRSLTAAASGLKTKGLTVLLENTVGAGAAIGSRFEELAEIRLLARRTTRLEIGYCLDTAHCYAAGYDISTPTGLRQTVREAETILGLDRVHVIHANDSKAPFGSHRDRHEHIGRGHIGAEAFRRILTHPKLRRKPFILETPIDREGDDRRNVEKLKQLCRRSPTTTHESS